MKTSPYTYFIAWVNEYGTIDKCYYGVKYAKGCDPSDFWIKYKTSSKAVKELVLKRGDPQIIEVRYVCKTAEAACRLERRVLCNVDLKNNYGVWLNRNVAGAVVLTPDVIEKQASKLRGIPKTKEHAKKIGDAQRGKPRNPESIAKMRQTRLDRSHLYTFISPNKGKPGTMLGKNHSDDSRSKMSLSQRNRFDTVGVSEETKIKMKAAKKLTPKKACPGCGREFAPNCLGNHKRFCSSFLILE